jgi:small subunit ribosomal protein S6
LKRTYELVVIFDPKPETEVREERIKLFEKLLQEKTTLLKPEEVWGKRKLAYPIKKRTEGIYILWTFETEPAQIDVINNYIHYEEMILRSMAIVITKKKLTKMDAEA